MLHQMYMTTQHQLKSLTFVDIDIGVSITTRCHSVLAWIAVQIQQFKMSFVSICIIFGIILYYSRKRDSFLIIPNVTESADPNKVSDLLSFLVIGDWGANPVLQPIVNQTLVANAMLKIHNKYSTQFVISVGDHFYDHGILTSQSKRWISGFENIYHSTLKPWYVIFGNHDLRGSVKAQIEYSKISKHNRWIVPSPFYAKDFKIPHSNEFSIHFIN